MDDRGQGQAEEKGPVCRQCGKTVAPPERVGSLTGYMFQGNYCGCNRAGASAVAGSAPRPDAHKDDFCPRCGLTKVSGSQVGSLTSYLFQDTRCRCDEEGAIDRAAMAARKFKEGGAGSNTVELKPGATVAGVYQIVRLIGRGGMGEVYLAKHLTLGKNCALKVIPPEQVTDIGWQRFQTEARIFSKLDHINLVRVTDLGIHEGVLPFYAMDYVEGQTLAEIIAANRRLTLQDALEIFNQVCDGVDFAHRNGIIHRDLKPANIMISVDGANKMIVKILDFGLAKLTQQDRGKQSLTAVGEVFGSPFYMSPEQCEGEKIDNRSDIYSIGCTFFESLTGKPPFTGTRSTAIMKGHLSSEVPTLASVVGAGVLPDGLELVVAKLLRKNPAERYQTMAEFKSDLKKVATGKAVDPFYVSRTGKTSTAKVAQDVEFDSAQAQVSKTMTVALITAGCLTLVLGGIVGFWLTFNNKSASEKSMEAAIERHKEDSEGIEKPPLMVSESDAEGKFKPLQMADVPAPGSIVWDGTPFYKGLVTEDGRLVRRWDFPINSTGRLGAVESENREIEMASRVTVPVGKVVYFRPRADLLDVPNLYKGFTDNNFDGLIFKHMSYEALLKVSKALVHMQSIKYLTIGTDVAGDDSAKPNIDIINSFQNIKHLTVDRIIPFEPTKIKRLRVLESLSIGGLTGGLDMLAAALRGSEALKELLVDTPEASQTAISDLSTCPNLTNLAILPLRGESKQFTGKDLMPLTRLQHLRSVQIGSIKCDQSMTQLFKEMPSLRTFQCQTDVKPTAAQYEAWHEAAPLCKITFNARQDTVKSPASFMEAINNGAP